MKNGKIFSNKRNETKDNSKHYYLYKKNLLKILLLIIKFILSNSKIGSLKINLINGISEIKLVIQGNGRQSLLGDSFNIEPFEVLVNGKKDDSCKKECNLEEDINNITLKFDKQIESCYLMFQGIKNIREIDLSNFDTSKVTTMSWMFCDCSNLEYINLGNINTSSVENMDLLFKGTKITSIDLSKFDTSKVTTMLWMFCDCSKLISVNLSNFDTSIVADMNLMFNGCSNLKYLDLSNFNTSKVNKMEGMFSGCNSLIFLNLESFKISNSININDIFSGISNNVKFCISDINLLNLIKEKGKFSNCSDDCFKKNIKIDINNNVCLDFCRGKNIHDNLCYDECPKNTYPKCCEGDECKNNSNECYNTTPNGYYLDLNNKIYKKCFKNCKYCKGEGNDQNNNCIECNPNFIFLEELYNNTNCYEKCKYYYYLDEEYNYYCTESDKCPKKYNKLIIEKNKCIHEYRSDDIYTYEFENISYSKFLYNTINIETNYISL